MGEINGTAGPQDMKRYPLSGLSVLVVGGGIAGIAFAIEAHRKGHTVRVLERRPKFQDFGDIIAVQTSALHSPENWPGFMDRVNESTYVPISYIKKYDGTYIGQQPLGTPDKPSVVINRSQFHNTLHDYMLALGIPIEYSTNVVEYFETQKDAGVILVDGTTITADVVVAADGIGSKSWNLVLGRQEEAISSGFALYRVTFPAELALKNPVIAQEFEGFKTRVSVHVGPGAHIVIGKTEKELCWVLTHKDDGRSTEDWTSTASSDDALPYVKGWTSFVTELINATPGHEVTDWKLMWRNSHPTWASPKARVIQIGDAAHTFLPTSGSGATMALEDAYSLASCLQLGGRDNAPLAVKVHNHLRFERVSCAQKMGFKTREKFHNTDWEAVSKNPKVLTKTVGDWILNHNPEQYVYENYGTCANHILVGIPFKNTNAVPGHNYKPWTVKELLEASERGENIVDDGDWS